jgi:N-methylhydantoinase A
VTDSNLLLGYLDKDYFLGGEMKVNEQKTKDAMRTVIADPLGMSVVDAAAGVFRIINQSMADATKVVSVQRGYDPREYALISAGGACSIHACKIAEEVGSTTVIVPKAASVFCALGMLESDIRLDSLKTWHAVIPGIDLDEFNAVIEAAEKKAMTELLQEGVERERASLVRHLDMRYVGQHHEVNVDIPSGCRIEQKHLPIIADAFNRAHEKLYTYSTPENPMEIMNLRITAVGAVEKTGLFARKLGGKDPAKAYKHTRKCHFAEKGGFAEIPVYNRDLLVPGNVIPGPAVIEERITTIIVHPSWDARIDEFENVVMEARS